MKTKSNFIVMALSTVVCLLPLILSFMVYNDLPEEVVIQLNVKGNPNRYLPKAAAAFGLPLFFAAVNIISKIFLYNDPKRENISKAARIIAEWIVPLFALALVPVILFMAMGSQIPLPIIALVFTGIVLILCGNYLPKSRQNYVIGIKLPWTLNNTDNWNRTHRMAGYLYMCCGIVLIIASFLFFGKSILLILILSILALMIIAPVLYSYSLYKRNGSD
ncbi:MAG: SdpI family protein [Treponema sp.]|jgi:uncharacterized membrane protein|nr:SdpI family protein [Treponema sp.]